ncbi:MAG: hypothetical protein J6P03_03295, partial [Opitutales bacterium]|nr:hypothetical protein [Opitutales bacterium]
MKKPKRGCLIFAAGVGAVFAAACFVLSSSALQTKIANSEIQKRFPNGSVKKVSISPFGAEIESLELEFEGGKTFAAQKLSAKYFLPALVFGELEISELSLAGAEYRKTAAAPLP